jgi:S-adenosylmethionine-dependent methyltransferase
MSDAVRAFYTRTVEEEWSRMDEHPLEFELTKRHIDSILEPGSEILDLGGGPGKYAFHYAALGHAVTLVDLTPANVDFARARQAETGIRLRDAVVGDARSLPFLADGSFDLVLCMGPMYHITEKADRAAAIAECRRLARPGGHVVLAYISHMAQCLSILKEFPGEVAAWEKTLRYGLAARLNDTDFDTDFTEARFTGPRDIGPELEAAGLELVKLAGAEGFGCLREDSLKELRGRNADAYRRWMDLAYETSEDPSLLGANEHLVAIARKAGP